MPINAIPAHQQLRADLQHLLNNPSQLCDGDAGFIVAYLNHATTYTPDLTTRPYDADGILAACLEIVDEHSPQHN